MNKDNLHGGAREGAGRKPISDIPLGAVVHVRLSADQKEKFDLLGGGAWLRRAVDKANVPVKKAGK